LGISAGHYFIGYGQQTRPLHRFLWALSHSDPEDRSVHVHHINGNGFDNRIENLQLLSISDHMKIHAAMKKARKQGGSAMNDTREPASDRITRAINTNAALLAALEAIERRGIGPDGHGLANWPGYETATVAYELATIARAAIAQARGEAS